MLSRKGFTLLELMLALALFASGTVAIMELLRQAEASRTDGENILIATHLAQRRLPLSRTLPSPLSSSMMLFTCSLDRAGTTC